MDPMYQYSLEFFVFLFTSRLQESKKSEDMDQRIAIVIEDFTNFIYVNICK